MKKLLVILFLCTLAALAQYISPSQQMMLNPNAVAPASIGPTNITSGLVMRWYPGVTNVSGTTNTPDASGNGNTGQLMNAPVVVSSSVGPSNALQFGTSQYVYGATTIMPAGNKTISLWVYPLPTSSGYVLDTIDGQGGDVGVLLLLTAGSSGYARIGWSGNFPILQTTNGLYFPTNQWTFYVATFSTSAGGTGIIYTNGFQALSGSIGSEHASGFNLLMNGRWVTGPKTGTAGGVGGSIADVSVYNRVLSAGEISNLWQAGLQRKY